MFAKFSRTDDNWIERHYHSIAYISLAKNLFKHHQFHLKSQLFSDAISFSLNVQTVIFCRWNDNFLFRLLKMTKTVCSWLLFDGTTKYYLKMSVIFKRNANRMWNRREKISATPKNAHKGVITRKIIQSKYWLLLEVSPEKTEIFYYTVLNFSSLPMYILRWSSCLPK